MKNFLCILTCLCLFTSLLGCGNGETKTDVTNLPPITQNEFRGKDAKGNVGDTIDVVFELGKNTPIAAADFLIEFDADILQYVETKQIYKFQGGYIEGNDIDTGVAKVAMVTLDPPVNGGDIFSVSFKILSECKEGSEIKVSALSCCDENYEKIDLLCKGAKVFSK